MFNRLVAFVERHLVISLIALCVILGFMSGLLGC
jgi:hypothetical protein